MKTIPTTTSFATAACALAASGCLGSNVASGPYDLFPPISSGMNDANGNDSLHSHADAAKLSDADVVIRSDAKPFCRANESALRTKADALLDKAIGKGFAPFPIEGDAYRASLVRTFFTEGAICTAFTHGTGATPENHNARRNHFKESAMSEAEAAEGGLVARRLPVRFSCPNNYDWRSSPVYNGVDSCDDVTSKIGPGVPTAIYALPMPPEHARHYLTHPSAPALYSRYANKGPVMCDGHTKEVSDSFHSLYVSPLWSDLHFIMRIWDAEDFSAWNMRRSCSINGKNYAYDDLIFNFGMRVYLPVTVDIDGEARTMSLIVSGVAAASNSWVAGLLPADLPYERWVGGEFAKKILVESWANEWDVR